MMLVLIQSNAALDVISFFLLQYIFRQTASTLFINSINLHRKDNGGTIVPIYHCLVANVGISFCMCKIL